MNGGRLEACNQSFASLKTFSMGGVNGGGGASSADADPHHAAEMTRAARIQNSAQALHPLHHEMSHRHLRAHGCYSRIRRPPRHPSAIGVPDRA